MANNTLTVTIVDNATPKLKGIPEQVRAALRAVIVRDGKALADLVRQKLSGSVLHVRTGQLLDSINNEMHETTTEIYGTVYSSGVAYAGIQEYGGQTRPHEIRPINARALHFFMGDAEVFAKSVQHPGSNIPARSYLVSSLNDLRDTIVADLTAAGRPNWQAAA